MSISWGGWVTGQGGARGRIGTEVWHTNPSTVGPGTTSVDVRVRVWFGSDAWVQSTYSWSAGGAVGGSGSGSISHGTGGGQTLIADLTESISTVWGSTRTVSGSASISNMPPFSGGFSRGWSHRIPRRPRRAPNTPGSVSATYRSDSRIDVNWSRPSGWDGEERRVGSYEIERQRFGSDSWTSAVGRTATSWAFTSAIANRAWRFRVRALNSDGSSSYTGYTPYIPTSAATPSRPAVTHLSTGGNRVRWNLNRGPDGVHQIVQVQHRSAAAGSSSFSSWSTLTTTDRNVEQWTHPSPDTGRRHQYRIRAGNNTGQTETRWSSWTSASATVDLAAPPLAPTSLSPNGIATDPVGLVAISWTHRPTDSSEQSRFQVRHRIVGTSTWAMMSQQLTDTQSSALPESAFSAGDTTEWQVRTWGEHPDPSPYSASATILASTTPVVTITRPAEGETIPGPDLDVAWDFTDSLGGNQDAYQLRIYDSAGEQVRSASGNGTRSTLMLRDVLADGEDYTLQVRGRNGDGLWSDWAQVSFTVVYELPHVPTIEAQWLPETAAVEVVAHAGEGGTETPGTDYLIVERAIAGGEWLVIADQVEDGMSVVDPIPHPIKTTSYRVRAVSEIGSTALSPVEGVGPKHAGGQGWIYFNYGPDFNEVVRVRDNAAFSETIQADRTETLYAGRSKPFATFGEHDSWTATLGVQLHPYGPAAASRDDLSALALSHQVVCMRNVTYPSGQRRFVTIDSVSASQSAITQTANLAITEADFTEGLAADDDGGAS